jgi:hypothetical protein
MVGIFHFTGHEIKIILKEIRGKFIAPQFTIVHARFLKINIELQFIAVNRTIDPIISTLC